MSAFPDLPSFIHKLSLADLPHEVVAQARRCLLDLVGVAAAGSQTRLAGIANDFAAAQLGSSAQGARMLFDGRRVSVAGAAFAGAATIDAFDAHDGHRLTKGHAGVAVLPALLAFMDCDNNSPAVRDPAELLIGLCLGYEIGTRAGIALHASTLDYHCSGAWNALACAAIGARLLGLDSASTRHALGTAEYSGPRGQILRVCETPSMLKDGSAWGAFAGGSAALLAQRGFTGAPAVTVESAASRELWSDLGSRWRIGEQYFKPYPVCHWAQQAITAALALQEAHRFTAEEIAELCIETFAEAVALGSGCAMPHTTEEAQYSLPFPVAAALVFGRIGAEEIGEQGLQDARIHRLLTQTRVIEDAAFSRRFPAERWARVRVELRNGRSLVSDPMQVRGVPENPLTDAELHEKFHALAEPVLGSQRSQRIAALVDGLPGAVSVPELLDAILASPQRFPTGP